MSFDSVLVANRGEIACRIIRTARAIGLRTIAVYSDADEGAPHVVQADDAVRIGPPPAGESYLRGLETYMTDTDLEMAERKINDWKNGFDNARLMCKQD